MELIPEYSYGSCSSGSLLIISFAPRREEEEEAEIQAALSMRQMMAKAHGNGNGIHRE